MARLGATPGPQRVHERFLSERLQADPLPPISAWNGIVGPWIVPLGVPLCDDSMWVPLRRDIRVFVAAAERDLPVPNGIRLRETPLVSQRD